MFVLEQWVKLNQDIPYQPNLDFLKKFIYSLTCRRIRACYQTAAHFTFPRPQPSYIHLSHQHFGNIDLLVVNMSPPPKRNFKAANRCSCTHLSMHLFYIYITHRSSRQQACARVAGFEQQGGLSKLWDAFTQPLSVSSHNSKFSPWPIYEVPHSMEAGYQNDHDFPYNLA